MISELVYGPFMVYLKERLISFHLIEILVSSKTKRAAVTTCQIVRPQSFRLAAAN